jgi:hypothetical protein
MDKSTHLLGNSGAVGLIPEDHYMKKIEQTNYPEDPNIVENYYRSTLVDLKPDKPWLASDIARSSDDRGGGFHSVEHLNLRHGASRSLEDPWLPDGTFLDYEFTERDPRGTALGPDMREHVKQQYARADLIKYYNDSDYSVPSEGINPETMRDNIKAGMYMFKDRYQNFEESQGAWHNGGTGVGKRTGGSDVGKYTTDGTIMDLVDAQQGNRTDAVARLSADPKTSYRHSTPDHRFKIAKYGMIKPSQFLKENDWSNNRLSTHMDDNQLVEINGQMVNRMLANLIIDLEGIRSTKQEIAKGAEYGDSYMMQLRKKKLNPEDIYKIMMIDMTMPNNPNSLYDGKMMVRKIGNTTHENRDLMENALTNHEIAESMQQATKLMKERDVKDLRDNVFQTASNRGMYHEGFNRRMVNKSVSTNRDTQDTRHIENSREIVNYAGIKPSTNNKTDHMLAKEQYGAQSLNTKVRKSNQEVSKQQTVDDHEYDQDRDRLDFGVFDRASRASAQEHMGRESQHNMDIGDMDMGVTVGDMDLASLY